MRSGVLLLGGSISGKQELHHFVWEILLESFSCLQAPLSVGLLNGMSLDL